MADPRTLPDGRAEEGSPPNYFNKTPGMLRGACVTPVPVRATDESDRRRGYRLLAKSGLWFKTGSQFELQVPASLWSHAAPVVITSGKKAATVRIGRASRAPVRNHRKVAVNRDVVHGPHESDHAFTLSR